MGEAIFIFQDKETEMAVAVRDCDEASAMQMLHATLTSDMALPLKQFDALEFATCFVAVNKKGPYDVLFCGEFEDDALDDVANVYDCKSTGDCLVVTPMEFSSNSGVRSPTQLWALKQITIH
tara:strand:- start:141 stop:506 length:366 start_codon:yes stop_codon:yes gene_type:complete